MTISTHEITVEARRSQANRRNESDRRMMSAAVKLIARHGASRFPRLADPPIFDGESKRDEKESVIDRAGFVRPSECEYLIFPEVWQREILRGVDSSIVHKALLKVGILRGDSEKKASTPVKIDGKTKRFYVVDAEALDRELPDRTVA